MNFDRLREKGTPWHFWESKSRLTGVPKKYPSKNMEFAVTPLVLTPFVPFRAAQESYGRSEMIWVLWGVGQPGGNLWSSPAPTVHRQCCCISDYLRGSSVKIWTSLSLGRKTSPAKILQGLRFWGPPYSGKCRPSAILSRPEAGPRDGRSKYEAYTPNLPTNIIPTNIAWLICFREIPYGPANSTP